MAIWPGVRFEIGALAAAVYPPGATLGPRELADFELVWIEEGHVTWEVGGVSLDAPPGTALLARPGMRDRFVWDPNSATRHGFVHFTLTRRGKGMPRDDAWPLARSLGHGDIIRPLLKHLAWLSRQGLSSDSSVYQSAFSQVLWCYSTGLSGTIEQSISALSPAIERAFSWVQRSWQAGRVRPVALPELARAAGVSRGHLNRLFRQEVGATPAEALRLVRLDRAATLLARTNASIKEIAEQTGFESPFHFSRAFRKEYSRSPRAFREAAEAGAPIPGIRLSRVRRLAEWL